MNFSDKPNQSYDPEKIISNLLKNKKIKARVDELKLSKEQLIDAIPILLDMDEEIDSPSVKYLTSIDVDSYGNVQKIEIPSSFGKKMQYLDNVVTQHIFKTNFELEKEFIREPSRKIVVDRLSSYLAGKEFTKGMYIYGSMGIGKTFLMKRIAKHLAENKYKVAIANLPELVNYVKSKFGEANGSSHIMNLLKNADFLFLDDIGAETITRWFRDDFLFPILDYRMQHDKTTMFSGNYSLKQLEEIESRTSNSKYKDLDKAARLISRISSLADPIKISGTNKR